MRESLIRPVRDLHRERLNEEASSPMPALTAGRARLEPYLMRALGKLSMNYALQMEAARNEEFRRNPIRFESSLLMLGSELGAPGQWVALTAELGNALIRIPGARRHPLPVHNLLAAAFSRRSEHLTDWSPDILNRYNPLFYQTADAYHGIPSILSHPMVSRIIGRMLFQGTSPSEHLRVTEVGAGPDATARWIGIADDAARSRNLTVTLSDSSTVVFPMSSEPGVGLTFGHDTMDLSAPPEPLADDQRYHALVATYVLDSISFPGDQVFLKSGQDWYRALYRLAIPDWHGNRDAVMEAFRTGLAHDLTARDFESLLVERMARPINLHEFPEIALLSASRFRDAESGVLLVPAGIVTWIDAMFEKQLRSDGVMILGDAGFNDPAIVQPYDLNVCGRGARFRGVDFLLLGRMLEARGYAVEVSSIGAAGDKYFGPDWETGEHSNFQANVRSEGTHLMTVRRRTGVIRT